MRPGDDTAAAARGVGTALAITRARLSMESDLMICATADGRALVWLDGGARVGLGSLKGGLGDLVCHQLEAPAKEMADCWNASGGAPVSVEDMNAALARAWGVVRIAAAGGMNARI